MRPRPIRVVHLFSETASGFIARLWIHQLAHLDPNEFRLSLVVPDRHSLGARLRDTCQKQHIRIHEVPALAHLMNPVYAFRSRLSLRLVWSLSEDSLGFTDTFGLGSSSGRVSSESGILYLSLLAMIDHLKRTL